MAKSHIVTITKNGPEVLATFTAGQELNGEMEDWLNKALEHWAFDSARTIIVYVDKNGMITVESVG